MNRQDLQGRELHERSLELSARAVDVELTNAETTELEAHLAACPTCARRTAALRADASMLGSVFTLLPSSRVDAAVYAAIARRPARPQRLMLLAAAALLLVALLGAAVVGGSMLRSRQTLPTTVVPTPTLPVAVVDPTTTPEASPPVVGEAWRTVDFPKSSSGSLIEAATFAGTGLVGVGRGGCLPDSDNPTHCYAAAWTAAAGDGWTGAPDQPGLEVGLGRGLAGPTKGILDVVDGPAGLVAIGFDIDPLRASCRVAPCTSGPGIWRSPDGQTWERAQVDFGPSTIDTYSLPLAAIAASPRGYVIVGYAIDYAAPGPNLPARATAWTSPDGVTWTRAVDSADMDVGPCQDTGEEPSCGGMRAVVATASGYVAVGQARSNAGDRSRPAAWTSPDGRTWTRSDAGLGFEGLLSGVTAGGPGLVAVGLICQPSCVEIGEGVAATSRDGSTWTFSPVSGATALEDVAFAGGRAFALAAARQILEPKALELWRSEDGVAWQRVTGLPSIPDAVGFDHADLSASDDRLVIVGWGLVSGADGLGNFAFMSPFSGSSPLPNNTQSPIPTTRPSPAPSPRGSVATDALSSAGIRP
jgi:anti-sigma factor RsiW